MGWSDRRARELAARGRELRTTVTEYCPNGATRIARRYNPLAGTDEYSLHYRHPDGRLFTCVAATISDCQARRNAWLVKRVADAQRERAKAEAQEAAAQVDADLYRDSRSGGYDR